MIPTAANPLRFTLRMNIPALKNNRRLVTNENTGKTISLPQAEVIKAIRNIKAAVGRQLPPEYQQQALPLLPEPLEICIYVRLGIYYLSALPRADVDNAYTTIQESMQDLIYTNDRQVRAFTTERVKFESKDNLHTLVYVWTPDPGEAYAEECLTVLNHRSESTPSVPALTRVETDLF